MVEFFGIEPHFIKPCKENSGECLEHCEAQMKTLRIPEAVRKIAGWLRSRKVLVVGLILTVVIAMPRSSPAQFLPSPAVAILSAGLNSVTGAISNVLGKGLDGILSTMSSIEKFERTVVWPKDLIDEARGVVESVREISGSIGAISKVSVASATLASPKQLERTLLSANADEIPNVSANYAAVYLSVPGPLNASPEVRNIIDMTDAVAQAAMKRAIEIDAIADIEIEASDQILQQVQTAAPGSAPILEAGASAWLVRANAYTQSALTEVMRLRAIDIANAGAQMKVDAQQGTTFRENVTNSLQRR
jgi:hypothetical protein